MHETRFDFAEPSDAIENAGKPSVAFCRESTSELSLIICAPRTNRTVGKSGSESIVRAFDLGVALLLLIILAPLLILIAFAILLIDGMPIIFAHRRVGKDGRSFACYKFRTMYADAEQRLERVLAENPALRREWNASFKLEQDPRVTWIGHLLRVTSLDELPQLFNVVAGDMSLVGPRPIIAAEMQRYGRYIGHYLSVKPGLTGVWQISGRSHTSYRRRVAADVLYVRSRALTLNIRILIATIPAVLAGEGSC